ncbi:PREDICTED: spindle and kinetochore-associated protein 1 homolog [Nicotiana attenuata]|uniref:SKA complex subunit 1 homolog n=1 Tax=Nicotiana attenuata TaxID=49451 RepID=A0A1J6IT04_NICAT|nr:PREDICTED: spindle and kinetochore-associated protein 1 homolog [Nicotiana attenuata]XP_019244921.1 PREDICTED: spindle and kinetochore-associated protein 1 homolog [Nicotiana attenuata]OIT07842.1 spindle and kinetochore-associated protein 1-like protein [Nicotiana attenuata]
MDVAEAGSSLDSLVSSFNARIAEIQQLVVARNMYPASSISDLSAVDSALTALELQLHKIKIRMREETEAIPKAKKLIEASLRQQKKLQKLSAVVPSYVPHRVTKITEDATKCVRPEPSVEDLGFASMQLEEPAPKEKKGRASPPLFYINADELNSVPPYMKQRLTLEKVNAAIDDMATYSEATAQLLKAPHRKLTENLVERAMELKEIAATEAVKGKHFFLESDIKGPSLKHDHTGRAILTVLRHLGRISETRVGHHRVILLLRPH